MQRVAEAAMQVMGTAGKHQVNGAETGFASAMGGVVQYTAVTVVSKNL
jgi:acetyl-CoA C-acetyltransferase